MKKLATLLVLGILCMCASVKAASVQINIAPDPNPNVVEYRLYVSLDNVDFTYVGNTRDLVAPIGIGSGFIPEEVPVYFITAAFDAAGLELSRSAVITYIAPLSAVRISGIAQSPGSVFLSWRPTNISHTGYQIARSTDGIAFTRVFNVFDPSQNSFLDTTVVKDVRYYYQVRAFKGPKFGPWSNVIQVVAEK